MNSPNSLNTPIISQRYREKALDLPNRRLLMTNFNQSQQQQDFSLPSNCGGFGSIHHFRRFGSDGWPSNPLPIDPACRALGLPLKDEIQVQVFQNAVCNWRCWYCFVDYTLLSGHRDHSAWLSADDIVQLYHQEENRPVVIDLSGGQPDLVPEWVPWMMEALQDAGIEKQTFLWSDDNLSTDYFWRHLSPSQHEMVASYPNYARVCCFKGFDEDSFAFNTKAEPGLWHQQFDFMRRFVELGIDLYGYVSLTALQTHDLHGKMKRFVDKLQEVHPLLPLRVVPLEIKMFSPVSERIKEASSPMRDAVTNAIKVQWQAVELWQEELESRFTRTTHSLTIDQVELH